MVFSFFSLFFKLKDFQDTWLHPTSLDSRLMGLCELIMYSSTHLKSQRDEMQGRT